MDFDVDKIVKDMNFDDNMHKKINNLILTKRQIDILNKYNINYQNCQTMNELLYYIDSCLNETNEIELELISSEIAETNYYMNTNK